MRFLVARPLEEALREHPDVQHVFTRASEGRAVLHVRFRPESPDPAMPSGVARVREVVEPMGELLPEGVLLPLVQPSEPTSHPAFLLPDPQQVDAITDALERQPEIVQVRVWGRPTGTILTLDPERLATTGLSVEAVSSALAAADPLRLEPWSAEALGALRVRADVSVDMLGTLSDAEPDPFVTDARGRPAVLIEVVGASSAKDAGTHELVALEHRVDVTGTEVPAADGQTATVRTADRVSVYFESAASQERAIAAWTTIPGLRVRPVRSHAQQLLVVAPEGVPPALPSELPVVPLLSAGAPELQIRIDRDRARRLGLSEVAVAQAIRSSRDGVPIRPGLTVRVEVSESLTDLAIPLPTGGTIPLSAVVEHVITSGSVDQMHWDGLRVVPYAVVSKDPLEKAAVARSFAAAGLTSPFWLGSLPDLE